MAAAALNAGAARVDCIEVDPARVATLSGRFGRDSRVSVKRANFLELVPDPVYDAVLMNPPFFGVHYMAHVRHAFDFLRLQYRSHDFLLQLAHIARPRV